MPRFLHVGCGAKRKDRTLRPFTSPEWEEVTLDIDTGAMPDIVDKLPELAKVESGSFDAVFSSHNVEHLYPHEVLPAFKAFHRVLKDDGLLIVTCPDLQSLGEKLASGDIDTPLYKSAAGPISPIDVLYGFRPAMAKGNLYMAHHTGYTAKSIGNVCARAGFASIAVTRRPSKYDLWTVATKIPKAEHDLWALAKFYMSPV